MKKEITWDSRHAKIITELFDEFNKNKIKYFVLRNYKKLPEINESKDIDIIVEPKSIYEAKAILKHIFKSNEIIYYYERVFSTLHCCHGINNKNNFSIHIDLISSYVSKGYEIFTFDEMYNHTISYKNFYALNDYFEGVMVFIYKQFNYNPKLKEEYKKIIYNTYKNYSEFEFLLNNLLGRDLTNKITQCIEDKDFDLMLSYSKKLTHKLKNYTLKKRPIKTIYLINKFITNKINTNILHFNKNLKFFSVMAPDGAGKTTFLDNLLDEILFYFVNSVLQERITLYHFRPTILPNLGAIGEKAKVMKQDTDYSNPHRAKPATKLSSLVRITYYWFDYIIGYIIYGYKDVKFEKFTVFDRYIYDFIVDPRRSRINLPTWVRKLYVKLTPQPKIVFYLHADPDVIFKRKQELTLEEIKRQNEIYLNLAKSHPRFKTLDANRHYNESVNEALEIILNEFCEKL